MLNYIQNQNLLSPLLMLLLVFASCNYRSFVLCESLGPDVSSVALKLGLMGGSILFSLALSWFWPSRGNSDSPKGLENAASNAELPQKEESSTLLSEALAESESLKAERDALLKRVCYQDALIGKFKTKVKTCQGTISELSDTIARMKNDFCKIWHSVDGIIGAIDDRSQAMLDHFIPLTKDLLKAFVAAFFK